MSIRTRFLIACLLCALVPLVGYAGYTYARTAQHLYRLEDGQLAAREGAVGEALQAALDQDLRDVEDAAAWPDFVQAVRRGDENRLRKRLAGLHAVLDGGSAQLLHSDGSLWLEAGAPLAGSLLMSSEGEHVVALRTSAAGYETLEGLGLSIVVAQSVGKASGSRAPLAHLVVVRPLDEEILETVGTYAGVRVSPAPQAVTRRLGATPPPASNGVMNQFGETFTQGPDRSAYLVVYDVENFPSGLLQVFMERSTINAAVAEIRTVAVAALVVALAVAIISALLLSRRLSRPLQELAAAAVGMAGGETRQEIHVGGKDEVGQLAGAFNAMSERVSEHVVDLSGKLQSLTEELADVNVVFGETIADAVDVDTQWPRMLPHIESMMKADRAELYLPGEGGALLPAGGDARPDAARMEAAARQAVAAGSAGVVEAGESSLAAAPLKHAGLDSGALVVLDPGRAFDAQDLALLSALAAQLALVHQNAETLQHLEDSYYVTVTALASAVEAKEGYTVDHCRTIAGMAEIVGGHLDLGDTDLRLLRYAAILHDIGKTAVPGTLLRSTAPFTEQQSALIAGHTLTGESIVGRIPYLSPIAPVIRSAHERWDGGGYPDRLRGEDIPLAARIVFACDSCHAMVSNRPYRKAMTHEAAFAELEEQAGAQFDPRVVDAFFAMRAAVERLLKQGPKAVRRTDRVLATVLVTDIVGSTEKAAEIGDRAYRLLIDRHHAAVRDLLRHYRGTEVDTAGDGFLATFDGAARAVECAAAVGRALGPLGLEIRAGCHTGEIEVTGAGVRGIAVHIGARVAALAGPGEILVSGMVKDLVAGSGLEFSDRGEHELKGVPGVWRLYAVEVTGAQQEL